MKDDVRGPRVHDNKSKKFINVFVDNTITTY